MARRPELIFLHGGPGYPDYLAEYFRDAFSPGFGLTFYDQAQGPHIRLKNLIIQLDAIVRGKGEDVRIPARSVARLAELNPMVKNLESRDRGRGAFSVFAGSASREAGRRCHRDG